jgi:penicillin-binding protein 1C
MMRCSAWGWMVWAFSGSVALITPAASLGATAASKPEIGLLSVPSFREVKQAIHPSQAWLLDRDGQALHVVRLNRQVQQGEWVPLRDISPRLAYAVMLAEDKNFEQHHGVDWQAALSATWSNVWHVFSKQRARGASTLTMQLVGLLDEDAKQNGRRSFLGKLSQTTLALRLEAHWTKAQILEAYLNLVSFRGELVGIQALSNGLFGKAPDGLDIRESAVAAVLLRAPNAKAERVSQRACTLLTQQGQAHECAALHGFVAQLFSRPPYESSRWVRPSGGVVPQLAPHFANKVLSQAGEELRSSLDKPLQDFALHSLRGQLAGLTQQQVEDGAVLVLDNQTGEVLAWVGSSGDYSQAKAVDGVVALRQAGSTLKPFLYAQAIQDKRLTAASLIEDAPYALDTGNGFYKPQNYEAHYRGWVSVRMALGGSLNIPAVKAIQQVGVEAFYDRLHQLGFASLVETADWYGYSLALGSADVSLLMLTNAYRSLANGGQWRPVRFTPNPAAPCGARPCGSLNTPHLSAALPSSSSTQTAPPAFSPASSFIVSQILSDRSARVGTFGMESWLATPYWSAVKTGTSKDMRDNWCIGFSRRYTVGVWVGNASGQPMHNVSGITGAAPVWRAVMDWLHRGDPQTGRPKRSSVQPNPPAGLVETRLQFQNQLEPERREWFIAGTERREVQLATQQALVKITYPAQGVIIALDPDIPPMRQAIPLRQSGQAAPNWQWRLDGKTLGRFAKVKHWLPQPGRHTLSLQDENGKPVDEVRFEVRAMKGKAK